MNTLKYLLIIIFSTISLGAFSQIDSSFVAKKKFVPKPRKALLLSLILPSSGQIYNRRYWKAPIVLGGFAGIGYWIYFNNDQYTFFKNEYAYKLDPDSMPDFQPRVPDHIAASSLRAIRDDYRKSLEKSYFAMVGYYGLVAIEAFVDAHLQNFDITDDLSMSIKPRGIKDPFSNKITPGLGITFSIK